jgi:transposase InsO family protein
VLGISPSTYYAAKKREENPSARGIRDEELKKEIIRVREKRGRKLYGAKKLWRELNRDGIEAARCTVERLMGEMGIAGVRARRKRPRTTVPGPPGQERPSDLLGRDFTAPAPNHRLICVRRLPQAGHRSVTPIRQIVRTLERPSHSITCARCRRRSLSSSAGARLLLDLGPFGGVVQPVGTVAPRPVDGRSKLSSGRLAGAT